MDGFTVSAGRQERAGAVSIRRALFSAPEEREDAPPMAVDAPPVPEDGLHVRLAAAVKEAGLPLEVVPDTKQDGRVVRGTLHGIGVEIRYAALPASEPPCLARSFHVTHALAFWKVVGIRRRQAVYSSHQYMWSRTRQRGHRRPLRLRRSRTMWRADRPAGGLPREPGCPRCVGSGCPHGVAAGHAHGGGLAGDGGGGWDPGPCDGDPELLAALAENFLDREMCLVDMRSDPCRVPDSSVSWCRTRSLRGHRGVFVELWYDERAQGIGIKAWPPCAAAAPVHPLGGAAASGGPGRPGLHRDLILTGPSRSRCRPGGTHDATGRTGSASSPWRCCGPRPRPSRMVGSW